MSTLNISINAEPLFQIAGIQITNSIVVSWFVSGFLILLALKISKSIILKGRISKLQLVVELIIDGLYNLSISIAGSKKTKVFFPYIATFFFFILISNWTGILPGAGTLGITRIVHGEEIFVPYLRAPTADINTTLALSLVTMFMVQVYGFKYLGIKYLKKFFNFTNPINAFVGILELVSDISKIISFTFRLFGNIFAGEVLLAVMAFLVPVLVPIPFLGLEIFVGIIQALVFGMLTLVFFNIATLPHGGEEH